VGTCRQHRVKLGRRTLRGKDVAGATDAGVEQALSQIEPAQAIASISDLSKIEAGDQIQIGLKG
jgi:hypothetical protein